jgi:phosphoribosyl 1,2-cyclic phosphodiesterase
MWDFTIRGARGTIPACGQEYVRYGGNTTCFSLQTKSELLIIDAGSGITQLGRDIASLTKLPPITIFFTHFHLDHVIGFPCFEPVYNKEAKITLMADPRRAGNWKETLNTFMGKPYWPVGLGEADAMVKLEDLPVKEDHLERAGVKISWIRVPHPQQCLAYKLEMPGNVVVIATDMEHDANLVQPAFLDFCRNADFLVCDAQYTPEEYPAHCGWGHSTWQACTLIAREAKVKQLVLTHHAPTRTDKEVDAIVKAAQKVFPNTIGAAENMKLRKQ